MATTIGRICLIISIIQYCKIGQPASIPCSIIFRKSPKGCVFRREVRIRSMPEKLMPHGKTVSLLKQIGSCLSACFHLCTEPIMNTVLIIGAGGVGHVVANKCAQLPDIFQNIHLASRTKSKCDAVAEDVRSRTGVSITTHSVDADDVPATVAPHPGNQAAAADQRSPALPGSHPDGSPAWKPESTTWIPPTMNPVT